MIWRSDNFGAAVIGIALMALWPRLTYLDEVEQSPFWEVPTAASQPYIEAARGQERAAVASPLYPLFLRGLVAAGLAPQYVQVLLGAVSCTLLALIGYALWGPGTGLVAALCAALYGPAIYFTGTLLPPVLAVFLVLLLLAALLWTDRQADGKAFLGVGLLLALCLLAAPQVALFAPAVLWWLWIGGRPRACWACGLGTAGTLALWYVGGVATSAGGSPDLLVRGGEHLPALDMYHARGDSAVLAVLLWKWGLAFPFGLVMPLALLGVGFALSGRERDTLLALLFVATGAVGTALYGAHAETRMVLVPVLLLFAVGGVGQLARLSWARRGGAVAGLVLIGTLVSASTPAMDRAAQASQQRYLGHAYAELGMIATAIAAYEQAVAAGSPDKDVYWALAVLYDASGKPERALGVSRAFVERWPADERGQRALGDRYMAVGRSQEARTIYQQLVADGGQQALLGRLGDAQLTSGALDEAVESYQRLLTASPDSSRVRYQLARAYAAGGRVADAERSYRQLLDSPVYGVRARVEAAALLRHNGQPAAAEPLLSQVLALAPDHREVLLLLGEVLLELKRPDEALPHWLRLAELEPRNWRVQGHLSRAYGQLGRDAEARDAEARYQQERRRAQLQQRIEVEQKALAEKNSRGKFMKRLLLISAMVLLHGGDSQGRQVLLVGQDGQISWEGEVAAGAVVQTIEPEYRSTLDPNITEIGVAPVNLVDFASADFPASILPRRVQEGQNLAAEITERGGSIRAPTVFDLAESQLQNILAQIVSPDPTGGAFERKGRDVLGTLLVLDLGARFGVNQIRFFPRNTVFPSPSTPFQEDFLKNFELQVNDGQVLTEAGNPIWGTFAVRTNNTDPVATTEIDPPRFLRFIRLRATSSIPFEVEKFQVFGEGFFPTVQYISPIIDMGSPANWGRLRWLEETVGQASAVQMHIRTRSGSDPSPFAYTRKRVGRQDAEEIAFSVDDLDQPLLRDEYLDLPAKGGPSDVWERGPVRDDLGNWSPWTSPYNPIAGTSSEGALVRSPGPRRYFQFRVDFQSDDLESAKILRQLSFDFTTPPLADVLVGEVFPREVPAAADIPFVYAVRAEMESGDLQGFDGFELVTGSRVDRIERIEIIDAQGEFLLAHDFAVQDAVVDEGDVAITAIAERSFEVRFPRVAAHNTVLKIHFVSRILSYSTAFEGRGLLLQEDAFQSVQAGDATALDEGDISFKSGTTVLSPAVNSGSLVGSFDLAASVITPNGDGINDVLDMECEVLAVGGAAQIAVTVYDLGGRRMRRLFNIEGQSGVYSSENLTQLRWDGSDDQGAKVAPGLYLIQLNIEGDARASASTRTVGVAY